MTTDPVPTRAGLPPSGRRNGRADIAPDAFWEQYTAWAADYKSPNTVAREHITWRHFVDFLKPATLGSVTPADVERLKKYLQTKKKRPQSPRTINTEIVRLQGIYNIARGVGRRHKITPAVLDGPNPFEGISKLRSEKNKPPRYLSQEQIEAVLKAAEDYSGDLFTFCALCVFAGLRTHEAVNLRWEHVDFEQGVISVFGKGAKHRSVPLHNRLRDILTQIRAPYPLPVLL